MKRYVLKNKVLEEYGLESESYFKTKKELEDAIEFLISEYNTRNTLHRQWTEEDFEIWECE